MFYDILHAVNALQKIKIEWVLRISLGLMYLYSGVDLILHPKSWTWAVPWWLSGFVTGYLPLDIYVQLQGGVELLMSIIFLIPFLKGRIIFLFAVLSSLELLFILLFSPQFSVTFRDIGILGASTTLCLIIWRSLKCDVS